VDERQVNNPSPTPTNPLREGFGGKSALSSPSRGEEQVAREAAKNAKVMLSGPRAGVQGEEALPLL